MRAEWRLAINSLSARRLRTALLSAAVALSAALVVAVTCAVHSLNAALNEQVLETIGRADAVVRHVGSRPFERSIVNLLRSWPEVALVAPQRCASLPLRNPATGGASLAFGVGQDPEAEAALRTRALLSGRAAQRAGEVVILPATAKALGAGPGDQIIAEGAGDPITLEIVGVARPPMFAGLLQRPLAATTIDTIDRIAGQPGLIDELSVVLREGVDARAWAAERRRDLPAGLVAEPSARITSGLERNAQSSDIVLTIVSVFAFLASAFIVLTGLATTVVERQRELAILRCIGASRAQVARAQLITGALVGGFGALVGAPLGVGLALLATLVYPEHFAAGLRLSWLGFALAAAGGLGAGALGAVWPAWRAARTTPIDAMAVRARPARAGLLALTTAIGAALALLQVALLLGIRDSQAKYWTYIGVGAPLLFVGYFLAASGVTALLARLLGRPVSAALRLPRGFAARAIIASPFRHGFTAGSLMAGLALLVALWTHGSAILRDWLGAIRFPDAFVHALTGMTDDDRLAIAALPFVAATAAVGVQRVQMEGFGVDALQPLGTMFVAIEPDAFFGMTALEWVEGDAETARRRLNEGGAVLVSREFRTTRGLGVGDRVSVGWRGETLDFEIAGVVSAPGLDVASKHFDIGAEYRQQTAHAMVGSRRDLIEKFHDDSIAMVQLSLDPAVSDERAVREIRRALRGRLVAVGSGRQIKENIDQIGRRWMTVVSGVAIAAMLIACLGVAHIVVAGVDARRFEFGVLRAVGARGGLLARLVIAETLIVALAACILGVGMGVHAAFNGMQLDRSLLGLELRLRPPAAPIAAGCAVLVAMAVCAGAPAAIALARKKPRELLGAMRG